MPTESRANQIQWNRAVRARIAIYSYYEAIFFIKINMKINNPFHPQNVCFYVYFLNRKGAIRKKTYCTCNMNNKSACNK